MEAGKAYLTDSTAEEEAIVKDVTARMHALEGMRDQIENSNDLVERQELIVKCRFSWALVLGRCHLINELFPNEHVPPQS